MICLDERTKDMKFYVLYHKNCFDGFGSAFCAWLHFGDHAKYIPVAYGEQLPEIPDGAFVYLLDFSFPKNILLELSNRTSLIVLDHHKSAEEDLKDLPFCKFDMTKSGAKLSYDFFIQMSPEISQYQWFIDYISDRDLWENKLPGTEEVHSALSSYPKNFEVWKDIGKNTSRLYEEGKPILRHAKTTVNMMCDQSFMTHRFAEFGHRDVPCVNATGYWSEICHEMLKRFPEYPFVSAYFKRGDGKTQWSLRSRTSEDFDVTSIARLCGGGGHKHASGFTE